MHSPDLFSAHVFGVLESKSQDALRRCPSNEFDALDNPIDDDVFDPRVLALSILSDQDGVDIIVRGLIACYRFTWSYVGEEVERSS